MCWTNSRLFESRLWLGSDLAFAEASVRPSNFCMSVEDLICIMFSPMAINMSTCKMNLYSRQTANWDSAVYLFLWETMPFECRDQFIDHAIEAADHDVGNDWVTERMNTVRDHSLQHLAQLEEWWRNTGTNLSGILWLWSTCLVTNIEIILRRTSFIRITFKIIINKFLKPLSWNLLDCTTDITSSTSNVFQ